MAETAIVQAKIDPELKRAAERDLEAMGLDTSTAIRMFFAKIADTHSIPFEVRSRRESWRHSFDSPEYADFRKRLQNRRENGKITTYRLQRNGNGVLSLPADFPVDLAEAWDGENVRSVSRGN